MLFAGLAVPLFGAAGSVEAADDPVIMTIGVLQSPDSLNPFGMVLGISYTILFLMYDTLNSVEPDFSAGQQLATDWYFNEAGDVWYYEITEDAVWHDGTPLTAHDIAFTYNLIMDNDKECALWIDYLSGFEEVVAEEDYLLRITLEKPKATMLSIMVPILPEHIWSLIPTTKLDSADYWKDSAYFPDGPVGSGPLVLDEYVADDFVRMKKWDQYHLGTVNMDEVLYKIYSSDDAMTNALQSGYIDVATSVPALVWDTVLNTPNIDGQDVPALSLYELGINCASEEWREAFPKASTNLETTNLAVRQAIAMMVDEDEIVAACKGGLAVAGTSLIPTATPFWHYYVPEEEVWEFNAEAANELLNESGYNQFDGSDFGFAGIRENETSGAKLDFIFDYRLGHPDEELAATMIEGWLEQIGIKAEPIGMQESQLSNDWFACAYDMYIWGWDADVDPSFMLSVMTTNQTPAYPQDYTKWSDCYYTNPVYDQLYLDQLNAVDVDERQAIVHEMQQILYYDCPYVVLWYPSGLYAYRTDTFYNYPDMNESPGSTPGTMWFFFEVLPYSEDMNLAPTDVDAGPDVNAEVGETLSFTGSARDPNTGDVLSWSWTFVEPDESEVSLDGQTVEYTFENLGEVDVTLTVTDEGGLSGSDSLVVTVEEVAADSGWINGYVLDGATEAPIVGAIVTAAGKTRTTNAEGMYNISASPAGTYTVNATANGYSSASEDVEVVTGAVTWQNFTLTSTVGVLVGTVTDSETGDNITSAAVKVTGAGFSQMTLTGADGSYQISGIPAGTFWVNVTKAGYVTNTTSFEIEAGETVTLDFAMVAESESGGGLSTAVIAGIGVVLLIVVAAVALMLLKKRKKGGDTMEAPLESDDIPPPDSS
jgi:peptide/nickel transport system substrate-binding protein